MPRIYRQDCKQCGKYYERPGAKYFCCLHCANINKDRLDKISKSNTGKIRSEEFKLAVGRFHKGNKWSLGKKASEATKRKKSKSLKKLFSIPEFKDKHKEGVIKFWASKRGIQIKAKYSIEKSGMNNHFFGKHPSKESIQKRLETKKKNYVKEKHSNWKGGISFNPYPQEFNRDLKRKIRERDNFTCQLCGKTEEKELKEIRRILCVNHIDFDKNNCSPDNLNTLCIGCNVRINYDREKYTKYFQERINYG